MCTFWPGLQKLAQPSHSLFVSFLVTWNRDDPRVTWILEVLPEGKLAKSTCLVYYLSEK